MHSKKTDTEVVEHDCAVSDLARAIAEAVAYADVFDYPLTPMQIRRYLAYRPATLAEVETALVDDPWLASRVERHDGFVCLAGRSEIIALRQTRQEYARSLWRAGRRLAWAVAHLPFVRMVAMIGSLSMDNVRAADDDIDLFVVTAPGRLWLTRAIVIGVVRLAAIGRLDLCPNYMLSSRRLAMTTDDLFTAHELAQMVPLYGKDCFAALLAANQWIERYLPNATPQNGDLRDLGWGGFVFQRLAEFFLNGWLGNTLEQRLQARKLTELRREAMAAGGNEVMLDAEVCKGHMGGHGRQTRAEYTRRLSALFAEGEQ